MAKKTGCSLGCFVSGYGKANWLDVIMGCKELHMDGQENWMLTRNVLYQGMVKQIGWLIS